jgi:hypothetical protein
MPLVAVTVTEPDLLDVTVFGVPYDPPEELRPLRRGSLGLLMDHLYERLAQPFTVEVTEIDGARHAGVIDLADKPAPRHALAADTPAAAIPVEAGGFLPGEDILICFAAYSGEANPLGEIRFGLPPEHQQTTVVLFGRGSGTVVLPLPEMA